jgi:hypothetical protein
MVVNESGELTGRVKKLTSNEMHLLYCRKGSEVSQYISAIADIAEEELDLEYVRETIVKDIREMLAIATNKDITKGKMLVLAEVILQTKKVPTYRDMVELVDVL